MQKRFALWQEILAILSIKMALIFVLWWFFFSDPLDKNLQPIDIDSHLFNTTNLVSSHDEF